MSGENKRTGWWWMYTRGSGNILHDEKGRMLLADLEFRGASPGVNFPYVRAVVEAAERAIAELRLFAFERCRCDADEDGYCKHERAKAIIASVDKEKGGP